MPISWTHLYPKFKGLWIALKDDEVTVIASGKTAMTALQKARKKGHDNPIMTHMPSTLQTYVGIL